MFQGIIKRYRLDGWEPQDLVKFQEHLSLVLEDFIKMAESRELHYMLECTEARLERCLAFYHLELGLSSEDLRRLVVKYPRVFSYGIETTVVPRMEFFEEIGLKQPHLKKVRKGEGRGGGGGCSLPSYCAQCAPDGTLQMCTGIHRALNGLAPEQSDW